MSDLHSILSKAEQLFFNYGVKSITMDDLSRHLGMSKKTVYLYVSNKADLVDKTMDSHLAREKENITKICAESKNAVDEMFQIGKLVTSHLRYLNPSVVYDIQKYYPETWAKLLDYKNSFLFSVILKNIEKGIEQGFYRQDINPDIISKIYNSRSEFLVDSEVFPFSKYKLLEVYVEYLKYHIRGIASDKGLKYLEKQNLDS